jgi:hypothetical protein
MHREPPAGFQVFKSPWSGSVPTPSDLQAIPIARCALPVTRAAGNDWRYGPTTHGPPASTRLPTFAILTALSTPAETYAGAKVFTRSRRTQFFVSSTARQQT